MEYKIVRSQNYLAHHGILGQKWGVRRYQNEDGSYTAEGKSRRQEMSNRDRYFDKNGALTSKGLNKFYRNGKLTENGEKELERFNASISTKNTVPVITKTVKEYLKKSDEIEKKYKNKPLFEVTDDSENLSPTKYGKKYLAERDKMWKEMYTKNMISEFGYSVKNGKDWVKSLPEMNIQDPDFTTGVQNYRDLDERFKIANDIFVNESNRYYRTR